MGLSITRGANIGESVYDRTCAAGCRHENDHVNEIIYFPKDYRNKLSATGKFKNFGFIAKMPLLGADCRDYIPIPERYKIQVIRIISNAALIDPHIYSLLLVRRRVVVFDYRILRGFGICITGTGIIPAVICGSRRVLTKLIHLQIARSFERRAERSPVTERIIRVSISIIIGVRRIAVVTRIVVRGIEGIEFMMSFMVMMFTVPLVITAVPTVLLITGIMPDVMTFVKIVIEFPSLTEVTVDVSSGHIIRPGLCTRSVFRLPDFLTEISALGA